MDTERVDYVALPVGSAIGRYEVLEVLGQGGFGITYLARDTQLGREVAVKEYLPATLAVRQDGQSVLPRSTAVADDFGWGRERFMEEGRTLANLHEAPAIVRVFDFLEANGTAYIVMERLRGETLEDRVRGGGPLPAAAFEAMLWPLLVGLEKVHEAGFLHRDIKPANIILGADDKATLIDFGASRAAMADRTRTMTAIFTPGYAAPEQFTAAKQGPWTDIYGLAATLYYAAAGEAPPSAFDRLMEDAYEPLASRRPDGLPEGMVVGIDAGLAVHLESRPRSIAGWRALMRGELRGDDQTIVMRAAVAAPATTRPATAPTPPTLPTPPTPPTRPSRLAVRARPTGMRRWLVPVVGAVLLAAAFGYYTFAPPLTPQAATVAAPPVETAAAPAPSPAGASVEPSPVIASASGGGTLAPDKPAPDGTASAESTEEALRLGVGERQRIQRGLTSLGFDTRGADGAFGPRSREMIAAWQKGQDQEATGFLTRPQSQALLRAAPPAPPEAPRIRPPAVEGIEGVYAGSLSGSATGGGPGTLAPMQADLRLVGNQLTGRLIHPACGPLPVALSIDGAGGVRGSLRLYEATGCTTNPASAGGRLSAGVLTLDLHGIDVSYRGKLAPSGGQAEAPRPAPAPERRDRAIVP
ncbi:serine/threonine-protein kinase [Reyranella sp.]|uniref:serine/threonine-protein kinase n=1 Tax=Reyranella sp. TaxID=1929291 RepID=UPI003BABAF39